MKALARAFWTVAGVVPIRVKILGIVIGVAVTLGVAVSILVYRGFTTTLERDLDERGATIAVNLATRSQDLILTDRLFALYTLAKDTVRDNADVLYVFITDPRGAVLVHTFQGGMPEDLVALPPLRPDEATHVRLLNTERGDVRHIGVPILAGRLGAVHVGMSEGDLGRSIERQIRTILFVTAAVVILGTIAAFGMATVLTRPLTQLARAAEDIGHGNFTWRPPRWAHDEIGRLSGSFARMAERLAGFHDELRRRDETRARLLVQVMTAQEEERRRIARELHDGTAQSLTSVTLGLAMIEDCADLDTARARAAEVRRQATHTLDEVRQLARGLRPSVLDDLGLLPALERYLKEYEATRSVTVDLHVRGFDGRLPHPVEIAVYRIVQEALTNTAKHAQASAVSVLLELRDGAVHLIVEDDGRGFDVQAVCASGDVERRLGLHGMRERATLLGGTLTVESSPGRGTTVFADIPLAAGAA